MEYMEALLQTQTRIAAELETEPEQARELWSAALRMRQAQENAADTKGARQAPHGAMRREGGGEDEIGDPQTEADAQHALRQLTELDAERARIWRLSKSGAQPGGAAIAAPAALPAQAAGTEPLFSEILDGTPRASAEAANARMQRSMQEISRFFERDARRYGG